MDIKKGWTTSEAHVTTLAGASAVEVANAAISSPDLSIAKAAVALGALGALAALSYVYTQVRAAAKKVGP